MNLQLSPHRRVANRRPQRGSVYVLVALLAAAALATSCSSASVAVGVRSGPLVVDFAYFHDELAPFGDWYWIGGRGWVWRPWGVGAGWVPYSCGRWIYTDWGWYWDSCWEWGWAPFHYGRWDCDTLHGWVWIPGRTWAPAWVAWRHRPGWIGWAPLGPPAGWSVGGALALDGAEPDTAAWSFVPDSDLLDPRLERRIAPRARSATLIEGTRPALSFEAREGGAAERGVPAEVVERATGRVVERRRLDDAAPSDAARRSEVTRDAVRPYRPKVNDGPARPEPERVAPPPAPDARSRARVESWERDEQRRLERLQRDERRKPPANVTVEELARRHEAERRALRQEAERRQNWSAPAPKAPAKPKPKPKPPGGKPPGEARG